MRPGMSPRSRSTAIWIALLVLSLAALAGTVLLAVDGERLRGYADQAKAARAMGIAQGQGFLYGRPSAPSALSELLRRNDKRDGLSTQAAVTG